MPTVLTPQAPRPAVFAAPMLVAIGTIAPAHTAGSADAAPPNPSRTATPSLPNDPADLAYTAAAVRFLETYRSTGMAGANGDIKDCYTRAGSTFQFSCIVLDATAFVMTYAFAQNSFPPPTDDLGEPAFRACVKSQLRLAGMKDETQMTSYTNTLIRRCGDALLAASDWRGPRTDR